MLVVLLTFFSYSSFSDDFETGEKYFRMNKPSEAIVYFTKALDDVAVNLNVYNYLGICYYQIGKNADALAVFEQGLKKTGTNKRVLYFNAGNVAYSMGDFQKAENNFSLAIVADPDYTASYLNRGNSRMKLDKLLAAKEDYEKYLILEPGTEQRANIEQVIALIGEEVVLREKEAERLAQEEARIKAEEERIAAELEAQRKEAERIAAEKAAKEAEEARKEAERRKKLLDEVAATLQDAESSNISAGIDGVMEYDYESELE